MGEAGAKGAKEPPIDRQGKPIQLIETLRYERDFIRLESHLARMEASAKSFGLPFDAQSARRALTDAVGGADVPLRVRLTLDEMGDHQVTIDPLQPNPAHWSYAISGVSMQSTDPILRHKTSWRAVYDRESRRYGTDEVLFLNERGELTEGARSNIFIARHGVFLTPPVAAGLLNGRLRAELLQKGLAKEARLLPDDLMGQVFLGNSLRGLVRAVAAFVW